MQIRRLILSPSNVNIFYIPIHQTIHSPMRICSCTLWAGIFSPVIGEIINWSPPAGSEGGTGLAVEKELQNS